MNKITINHLTRVLRRIGEEHPNATITSVDVHANRTAATVYYEDKGIEGAEMISVAQTPSKEGR